ncbi:hypothetical protein VB711_10965 [Cronbergia sp. UHCC 0137]|uniref:hypothetical protein n=1 Tax=Cronbergia sp. UHCC 0137 TaxID=3110239 RepID=UPI002B20B112|nr:hypothetical protein [Cronbergia sp. UHCC 0137]MEA5618353.1 hypothetical protein [Cronbergia sp. UHCC 0137]
MKPFLFLLCIPVLYFYPVLYPSFACFTSIFFAKDKQFGSVSLYLIFSSCVIGSLICATITPQSDTEVYIVSFKTALDTINSYRISLNSGHEPLYQVYEYFLRFIIGDHEKIFLLITALLFNIFSTLGLLNIFSRIKKFKLGCIAISIYNSLVAPYLGVPLFLLASSLSLSIMILAISFYKRRRIIYHILSLISIFIHYGSISIWILFTFRDFFRKMMNKITYNNIFIKQKLLNKLYLLILLLLLLVATIIPQAMVLFIYQLANTFYTSGLFASGKLLVFINKDSDSIENFISFSSPVFLTQIALSCLCFWQIKKDTIINDSNDDTKLHEFLEILRLLGKLQITLIIMTLPFSFLPYRLALFNFLYFPLWLINIPFISISNSKEIKNYSKYMILLALISLLAFSFYRIPKIQNSDINDTRGLVVLDKRPLDYNLVKLIEYFY